MFDRIEGVWRVAAGCRQGGFAAVRVIGCALVIAIATAADPSSQLAAAVDDGTFGSNDPLSPGASLLQFPRTDFRRILGKEVRSASDQAMGRIVDLLVDESGQPRAAIIDFGGFLGVGTRKIAIAWSTLKFDSASPDAPVVVTLDRDAIKAAPEYKESRDMVAVVSNRPDTKPYPDW